MRGAHPAIISKGGFMLVNPRRVWSVIIVGVGGAIAATQKASTYSRRIFHFLISIFLLLPLGVPARHYLRARLPNYFPRLIA